MINDIEILELYISKDIYSINSVEMAKVAFEELCELEIIESDIYWICKFYNCQIDTSITKKEFENYLIGLTRQHDF